MQFRLVIFPHNKSVINCKRGILCLIQKWNVHIQREISVYFLLCMIRSICPWKIFICYKAKAKIRLGGSGILRNNKNVMKMNLPKISTLNESYFLWITNKFCPCMTKKWLKFTIKFFHYVNHIFFSFGFSFFLKEIWVSMCSNIHLDSTQTLNDICLMEIVPDLGKN